MDFSPRSAPEALCVVRLSAIGDCCHALPVIRSIQAAWPTTKITWVIGKIERSLLEGADGIEFITFDKSNPAASRKALRRELTHRRFPILLHMHPTMRANLVSRCIHADRRIGFDRARARDFQWLFTNEKIRPLQREHVMESFFGFAEHLGLTTRSLRWDIPISDADRSFAAEAAGHGNSNSGPVCLISPCARQRLRNFRNWPIDRYVELVARLHRQLSARVIISGGPTEVERRYGAAMKNAGGGEVLDLAGATTLKQLLALIGRADVLICPDSGPAHMAAAVRTPVVGLYATTNPERAGPWFSREFLVNRYPEAAMKEYGQPVEKLRWGTRVRDPAAMELITVDDVLAQVKRTLSVRSGSGRSGIGAPELKS
jgi:heptosyltransferase I